MAIDPGGTGGRYNPDGGGLSSFAIHPDHPDAPKPRVNWPTNPVECAKMHPDYVSPEKKPNE
jgi:hypothetical protein